MKQLYYTLICSLCYLTVSAQIEVMQTGNTFLQGKLFVSEIEDNSNYAYNLDMSGTSSLNYIYANFLMPNPSGSYSLVGNMWNPHTLVSSEWVQYQTLISFSDRRLKQNIKEINGSLDLIKSLNAVEFDYIDSYEIPNKGAMTFGSNRNGRMGFIAQEIERVIPKLVSTDEDTGLKSVNYIELIPVLVDAIQELQSQVSQLQSQMRK